MSEQAKDRKPQNEVATDVNTKIGSDPEPTPFGTPNSETVRRSAAEELDRQYEEKKAARMHQDPHTQAAIANAVAQSGHVPDSVTQMGPEPEHEVVHPTFARDVSARPGTFWSQSSTYIIAQRDIFASETGRAVTSYTFDASTESADGDGNKIVYEGTVLTYTSGGKAKKHTNGGTAAIGVLTRRINVRNGDESISMALGGYIREDKCWDDGTFGTVTSGAKTDLTRVTFTKYDV
jgi:hypothetical protein